MAIVRKLEKKTLEFEARHTETECSYCVVTDKTGERFLQIDTYGSQTRKMPGKKSQSLRFSADAVKQLSRILEQF